MKTCHQSRPGHETGGYSLIEVVIAGVILMITIAAAVAMALTVVTQAETNTRITNALNYQEQAARLYQLGIATNAITNLLPPDPSVTGLVFNNASNGAIGAISNMERADCVMTFKPSPATAAAAGGTWVPGNSVGTRTNTVVVIRPTIR
jgi:type II secretory pathway pseudopilin PulG